MALNLEYVAGWLSKRLLEKAARLLKAEWTRQQVIDAMIPWGWRESPDPGGSHPLLMVHPHIKRPVPFQDRTTKYNDEYRKRHLAQAGLKLYPNGQVAPIEGHEYYPIYKMYGYLPGPLNVNELHPDSVRTWHPQGVPNVKYVNLNHIQEGDVPDSRLVNSAMVQMRTKPHTLPPIQVMDLGDNVYGTLDNHHLLAVARKAGMTHAPVIIVN